MDDYLGVFSMMFLFFEQKRIIMLSPCNKWQMLVDLRKQLVFPREIMTATP